MTIDLELKKAQDLNRKFFITANGQARTKFYVQPDCAKAIKTAAEELVKTIKHVSGADIPIEIKRFEEVETKNGIFFTLVEDFPILKEWFPYETKFVEGGEGFAVKTKGGNCYIFASLPRAVFFGAMTMIENSCRVIWSRGKEGEEEMVIPQKTIYAFTNFYDKPYFEIRSWHACGMGIHGKKLDPPTMKMFGKNKINGKQELFEDEYMNYGVMPSGVWPFNGILDFDDMMEDHPEYFMPGFDGKPKPKVHCNSFLNYYRQDVADLVANRYLNILKEYPEYVNYLLTLKAPDDWHFYMIDENGNLLHKLPFTADDGTIVYPEEPEYKSTVYWNFVNRVVRQIAKVYPTISISKVAYQYCEICPKIELDEHIRVCIAPITLSSHDSFTSPKLSENGKRIFKNIKKWCEKCKYVSIYEYWQCFNGAIYSRPNVYIVKEHLREYYRLGVRSISPEGRVDEANALGEDLHYDMNEMYYWITNRLMWNFDLNIGAMKENFCEIVYGNASEEMLRYYDLIEKGWMERDAYVIYSTGGDVYTKEFIINAGVADEIQGTLDKALTKKLTHVQRRKIQAIHNVVFAEIEKYSKLINEDAIFERTDVGVEQLLSQNQLDYLGNPASEWNRAGEIRVFKNYNTYEDYDPQAKFSTKLLYDDKYMYFGYTVYDDMLAGGENKLSEEGIPVLFREDGTQVLSYAELYIGGNSYNMSKYFGYISGIRHERKKSFYVNTDAPEKLPVSKNFKEAFFVHYDENPAKRYYFHVQAVPFSDIEVSLETALPYGSLVYYSDRYGRVGWKGNGLWAKQGFSPYTLKGNINK